MEKEIEGLNGIYKTIAQLTSLEDCLVLYQHLKGLTINFPTKLIDGAYVKRYVEKEVHKGKVFSKEEIQQLAISFDYSERQIRRFLSEAVNENKLEDESLPYIAQWLHSQTNGGNEHGK
ncbi:hypothetical protein [Enterococcus sp. AZ192]|uniref:hypothetical protein n=1 Tax=unclassified Enterococcus TaxID=2608891 RepID=UPI003D2AAE51